MLGFRAMGGMGGFQGLGGIASFCPINQFLRMRWGAYFTRSYGVIDTRILPPFTIDPPVN